MTKRKGGKVKRPRLFSLSPDERKASREFLAIAYPFKAKTWQKTTKDWHKAVYGAGKGA